MSALQLKSATLNRILSQEGTPIFIFDLAILRKNIEHFKAVFDDFTIFYSTKTNPEPPVVDSAYLEGLSFDAATIGEIRYLVGRHVPATSILFTHPIKTAAEIIEARDLGVASYTFDNLDDLKLLNEHAPGCDYLLRIQPAGNDSLYDYRDKFGAQPKEVTEILDYAVREHIDVLGLAFHVGSQSLSVKPWELTLQTCNEIITKYYDALPSLRVINIGSGFPCEYGFGNALTLEEIAATVTAARKTMPEDIRFYVEPGRVLVAPSAILVTEVVKQLPRGNDHWIFTDASVYHGLIEILESAGKFVYRVSSDGSGAKRVFSIAGKTLDPDDVIAKNVELPANIGPGDHVYVHDAGAYTTMFLSEYHFIKKPGVYFIDSEADENIEVATSMHASSGLVAKKRFRKGEHIFTVTGHFTDKRTRTSFQVNNGVHVEPTIFGAYLNHSCAPNAGIQTNARGLLDVVAMADIAIDSEVAVDYAMFEYELADMAKVQCRCGAAECRSHITGYKDLPEARRADYEGFVAAYLAEKDSRKTAEAAQA